jgi:cytochrome c551
MSRRVIAPPLLLVSVVAATVGLAFWHPFKPSAAAAPAPTGDATRGRTIFVSSCAGCHGADAAGDVGPPLAGSGLTAADVEAVVASGRGIMPAGIVEGQDVADVAAYVASIAK